ncbi:MAG TPA: valine--tRNA ligase, partial [Solimonas sp.]|nr:valine--tRNA ligase [Solimonas sp.]
ARLAKMEKAIEFLARVETPRVLADGETAPQSATALLGAAKLLVPMAGLIDKDAELARLAKQIAKLESDLLKTQARIDNPNFGKAPAAVQEQARQHHDKLQGDLRSLSEQKSRVERL